MSFINSRMDDEIKEHGKINLEGYMDAIGDEDDVELILDNPYDNDLHNLMYNEDYFKVYHKDAKDFMGDDAFDVIRAVQEYEMDNLGEVDTELGDAPAVANLYAYIRGEELLDEIIKDYRRDRINDRKRSDRNNNKMFDSDNDFKFRK